MKNKIISYFFLLISILFFLYVFYRSQIIHDGEKNNYYLKFFLVSFFFFFFSLISFKIKKHILNNPAELYPFPYGNHFNKEGYLKVTDIVAQKLNYE